MLLAKAILLVQELACRPGQTCTFFLSRNYLPVLLSRLTSHLICLTVSKCFWGSRSRTWLKSRKGSRGIVGHRGPCTSQNPIVAPRHHQDRQRKQLDAPRQGSLHLSVFPSHWALTHIVIFQASVYSLFFFSQPFLEGSLTPLPV